MWSTSLSAVVVTREKEAERRMLPPPPTFSLSPTPFHEIFVPSAEIFTCLRPRFDRPKSCL